ncbi:MAG: radical SAM protein [Rhodothermales bacterium]|nr:radical SAM protein [Rhodothermales bacterium]
MKPVLLNYYVTYRCNARCGFCDIWERPSPMAAPEAVRRNLRAARRLGVRIVDFTGGEPLLHPQLDALLRMAKAEGLLTTVTTNGLLYPKRARRLAGLVDLLHLSLDSSEPEEHDASRGVRCFGKVMESIETALSLGERPDLLFTVTDENVHRLGAIYERISRPNRLILILNPLFAYHGLGGGLAASTMATLRAFARRPFVYLNPAFLTLRQRGGNDPAAPVCRAASATLVISPSDELVLPCYHLGLDHLPIEGRLHDLWHSEAVARHRALEGRHAGCRGCTVNCYFEPSFAVSPGTRYFWESLPSKIRYTWTKFAVQRVEARLGGPRAATLPGVTPAPPHGVGAGDGATDLIELPVLSRREYPR